MSLSSKQKTEVEETIKNCLKNKFKLYTPETKEMPFHFRLLGRDRMALFSFIHSLNTTFGTSIFEPVALTLAKSKFKFVDTQISAGSQISEKALFEIQKIMDNLTAANAKPNKNEEIEIIRSICQSGEMRKVKLTKIDVFVESHSGEIYFFDIKTVKPNIGDFNKFKRTLLEWVAAFLVEKPNAKINSLIAIPYNPYVPKPYNRWTMAGMLDMKYELKVAEEFWDFLGGQGAYNDLLDCFERAGTELRDEIDEYFSNFKT